MHGPREQILICLFLLSESRRCKTSRRIEPVQRGKEVEHRTAGKVRFSSVRGDEPSAVQVEIPGGFLCAGNVGRLKLHSQSAVSGQDRCQQGNLSQSRSNVHQNVVGGQIGDGDQVKNVTGGGGLIGRHLRGWRQDGFARFPKVEHPADDLVSYIEAEAGPWVVTIFVAYGLHQPAAQDE